jgi:hypothetical protein
VRPMLKGRYVGIQESEQEVIWLQAVLHLEGDDPLKYHSHVQTRAGERGAPTVALASKGGRLI